MGTMSFQERVATLDLASPDEVKRLLAQEGTVVLDVRTDEEIQSLGKLSQAVHIPCTATDATELVSRFPEVCSTKETPLVIYCRSGRRALTAKRALEEYGYQRLSMQVVTMISSRFVII